MVTHEPDMAAYASRTIHFRDGLIHSDSNHDTNTAPASALKPARPQAAGRAS
jgi:ABC-type lipoprotein export system ATPase subunit